ncbi:hypothetical protein EJ110_NYTH57432 [Nymphaea thermarum]|nr:hypothetical protein EJ110_NYTH57432 [Nymphaea thermarum]
MSPSPRGGRAFSRRPRSSAVSQAQPSALSASAKQGMHLPSPTLHLRTIKKEMMDTGRRQLLSIMQQYCEQEVGLRAPSRTITTTRSQPLKTRPSVVESKSISEQNSGTGLPQSVGGNDLWASLESLHGAGVSFSDLGSYDFGSSSNCVVEGEQEVGLQMMQSKDKAEPLLDSSLGQSMVEEQQSVDSSVYSSFFDSSSLPPPPSPSIDVLLSMPPPSFGWNDGFDSLEMDAFEGALILSPLFSYF